MDPSLTGTLGGALLRELVGLGGIAIFWVSIKGSDVFLSGGGGRGFF